MKGYTVKLNSACCNRMLVEKTFVNYDKKLRYCRRTAWQFLRSSVRATEYSRSVWPKLGGWQRHHNNSSSSYHYYYYYYYRSNSSISCSKQSLKSNVYHLQASLHWVAHWLTGLWQNVCHFRRPACVQRLMTWHQLSAHPVDTESTVKPSVFACLLFRELNKTAKLNGATIDTIPTFLLQYVVSELCGLNSPKQKAPK